MYARVSPFDFGSSWGQAWIYGSRDGVDWELLVDGSARGTQTYIWGTGVDETPADLPTTLLGGTEVWVKAVLRTFNSPNSSYSMSQWARASSADVYKDYRLDVFSIELNSSAVPEPHTWSLLCLCFTAYFVRRAKAK